jgi:hypothetical protein
MKLISASLLTFMVAIATVSQQASAQEAAGPAPVDAFFCNYQEGKSMKDLLPVADKFKKWADKNIPQHSAWILTPRFAQFTEMPQMLWLGSSPNGNLTGKGLDKWIATGSDLQNEFNQVVRCGAHGVASSIQINAPDGPPGDGVVMFSQCSFAEGSDWSKAVAGHKKFSTAMRSMGSKGSNWLFFPMLGTPADRDFDYWGVSTFKSYADYFAAYEIYVTGGGWQKQMEIMNGIASCKVGASTVWDVKLVRQGTPE